MKKRILLSLDANLVHLADQQARNAGTSRSGWLGNVIGIFSRLQVPTSLSPTIQEKKEAHRRISELAREFPPDPKLDSTQIIRAWRDRDRLTRIRERELGL